MKKIVPFKKDIMVENLYEVTSISLEHTLKNIENKIEGEFYVSGNYRITETSINTEEFNYNLPFQIEIDTKYDIKDLEIDIDDFYYEIIDNRILSINIDVLLNNLEEIEREEIIMENTKELNCIDKEEIKPTKQEREIEEINIENNITNTNETSNINSIFNNLDVDTYSTYKVYIVRENDTIETILEKYNIKKEEIEAYNDLSLLKIGGLKEKVLG
ncbi:MAG: hypothetical protein IJZ36_03060, partial [Bacilli bacterium]|nr:hypothetical protein [Bacilli bacterium]